MGRYILNTATGTASPAVYVKQNDRGYTLDFEIRNGADIFNLTGCTVLVNLLKPDLTQYVGMGEITSPADGYVSVRLDVNRQMTAAAGEGTLELVIVRGVESCGTANARLIIQESPGSTVVSTTVVDGLAAMAADVASSVSTAENAATDAAEAYSAALTAQRAAEAARAGAEAIVIGNVRDLIFPVGSIVQYTDATIDPNTLLGGTWERIQGRFLFAADENHAIGTTGGAEEVALITSQLPAHQHYIISMAKADAGVSPDWRHTVARYDRENTSWDDCHYQLNANSNTANGGRSSYTGSGVPHNNMPPYQAVYIWERTA